MIVYFGSYTRPHSFVPGACGEGITICTFDANSGELVFCAVTRGILNPSYLALDENNEHLVAVSENFDAEGSIHIFQRQSDGSLLATSAQPSGGRATCHVCVTPGGHICASSYLDGGISVYPFCDGKIGASEFLFRYDEKMPGSAEKKNSHAHQAVVSPDARWLYVCDCGLNRIWRHALEWRTHCAIIAGIYFDAQRLRSKASDFSSDVAARLCDLRVERASVDV